MIEILLFLGSIGCAPRFEVRDDPTLDRPGRQQGGAAGVSSTDFPVGGTGGSSMFGAGGAGGTWIAAPRTGSGYGSGGGGGTGTAVGAAGSNGFLLVEW